MVSQGHWSRRRRPDPHRRRSRSLRDRSPAEGDTLCSKMAMEHGTLRENGTGNVSTIVSHSES